MRSPGAQYSRNRWTAREAVSICGYLEPLSAVLLSVALLHESLLPIQLLGAVLILGGAIFGECFHPRQRKLAKRPS